MDELSFGVKLCENVCYEEILKYICTKRETELQNAKFK
jgi:hypothetical protein